MIWVALLVGAILTAFYMTRLTWLVFFGSFRGDAETLEQAHESPRSMTVPLMTLAVLAVIGGWIGIPKVMSGWVGGADWNRLHHWLEPAVAAPHAAAQVAQAEAGHAAGAAGMLIVLAIVAAVSGVLMAVVVYRREGLAQRLARASGPVYRTLRNLFWIDELYDVLILRPFYALCRFFNGFDRRVIDGLVNAAGIVTELTGQVLKLFQTGLVRNYAMTFLLGVVAILFYLITR